MAVHHGGARPPIGRQRGRRATERQRGRQPAGGRLAGEAEGNRHRTRSLRHQTSRSRVPIAYPVARLMGGRQASTTSPTTCAPGPPVVSKDGPIGGVHERPRRRALVGAHPPPCFHVPSPSPGQEQEALCRRGPCVSAVPESGSASRQNVTMGRPGRGRWDLEQTRGVAGRGASPATDSQHHRRRGSRRPGRARPERSTQRVVPPRRSTRPVGGTTTRGRWPGGPPERTHETARAEIMPVAGKRSDHGPVT